MTTNYKINGVDTDGLFVRKDNFTDKGLWLWGVNESGQLGNNLTSPVSSPVQTIAGGTNWKQVSTNNNTVCAIKTDGTLWAWGYNGSNQIGDSTFTNRSSPVQTSTGGTNWKQVSTGTAHTMAIKTDGTLWAWGSNSSGQLGDNTVLPKSSPIQTITGGTNWKQVSCGSDHAHAIKTDGTLWGWGWGGYGQLGDNSTSSRSSPVQTVAGGNNWKQVSCGWTFAAGIKNDGTLWLWGRNEYGQLGDNTITNKSSPIQTIAGGNNWKQISCGAGHTLAIKTDGTLWTWGRDDYGQLGDNSINHKSSPVQTIAGGNNWKQVSAGFKTSVFLKTDGTLWTCGYGWSGQLGNNTNGATARTSSPVQTVAGGTNWKQASCNKLVVALKE